MVDWPELDAFVEEVRSQNAEGWQQTETFREQLSTLQPQLEVIARQYEELEVAALLLHLNQRLLAGLGTVELAHTGVGIEYVAALVWPAHMDPQRSAQETDEQGVFRIDVWLGPGLQDSRARLRISGAKRLEAVLPTTSERFRSALLSVFRAPLFVPRPASAEPDLETEDGAEAEAEESSSGSDERAAEEAASEPTPERDPSTERHEDAEI